MGRPVTRKSKRLSGGNRLGLPPDLPPGERGGGGDSPTVSISEGDEESSGLEEMEEEDEEDMWSINICLVCAKGTSSKEPSSMGTSLYDADFSVMFILKKMLELPSENLLDYLTTFGHPRKWIAFCGDCRLKISEAFAMQKKINEFEIKLRKFQIEVKGIVLQTYEKNRSKMVGVETEERKLNPLRVTRETWRFVGTAKSKGVSSKPVTIPMKMVTGTPADSLKPNPPDPSPPVIREDNPVSPTLVLVSADDNHGDDCGNDNQSSEPMMDESEEESLNGENDEDPPDPKTGSANKSTGKAKRKWGPKRKLDPNWRPTFNSNGSIGKNGYSCQLCPDLKPMKLDSFVKHFLFHTDQQYQCSVCDTYFTGSEQQISKCPKLLHKKEGIPDDHVCTKESLVPVTTNPEVPLECGYCQEVFSSQDERSTHEKEVHSKDESSIPLPHACSKCPKKFRDHAEWRLHRAQEHPELAKLGCFYCDQIFPIPTKDGVDLEDVIARLKHMSQHHKTLRRPDPAVTCEFCGSIFSTDLLLRDHLLTEHGQSKPFSCPICFERLLHRQHHRRHIQRFHGFENVVKKPLERHFICEACGYQAARERTLREHKMVTHGIEPEGGGPIFPCPEKDCPYKCTLRSSLELHTLKAHSTERQFTCNVCGKGFLTPNILKRHQLIHENSELRPFQCWLCGSSYVRRDHLYIHMRTKHQKRPFPSGEKSYRREYYKRKKKRRPVTTGRPSATPEPVSSEPSNEIEVTAAEDKLTVPVAAAALQSSLPTSIDNLTGSGAEAELQTTLVSCEEGPVFSLPELAAFTDGTF